MSPERRTVRVRCAIAPPEGAGAFPPGARIRVVLRDVSRADEPSVTVAEGSAPADGPWPERLELEADLTVGHHYAVAGHLDRSGNGAVAPGDHVTTVRVPVEVPVEAPADTAPGTVEVEVPLSQVR